MNTNALKGEIARNGMTHPEVASKIGMVYSTFWRKMRRGSFTLSEARALIDLLKIKDPVKVFFGDST